MTEMLSRLVSYRLSLLSSQLSRSLVTQTKTPPVELAYSCYQPTRAYPKEPPLVILHGLFGSKKNWASLARTFSNSGRKVITVDARNHGDSSHSAAMDYEVMSRDVERLLESLSIHRAIVLGHSMGGKTAMCLALTKPSLVEALIVEDVAPDSSRTADASVFPAYLAAMRAVTFDPDLSTLSQARQAADKQLAETFPDRFLRAFILTNLRQTSAGFEWRVNLSAVERHLDDLMGFPSLGTTYGGETLFVGGGESQHITQSDEPSIRTLFPRAQIVHVPGAGHWVHSEKPRELLELVQRFMGDASS